MRGSLSPKSSPSSSNTSSSSSSSPEGAAEVGVAVGVVSRLAAEGRDGRGTMASAGSAEGRGL